MLTVLSTFWQIALLQRGPEELPDSGVLLGFAVLLFVFADTAAIVSLYPLQALAPLLAADLLLLVGWCSVILVVMGQMPRLRRTVTALFGAGAVVQVAAYPFSVLLPDTFAFIRVVALVLILLWSIAVYGHVIGRAMSRSFGIGVAAAVVYFVLSFELLSRLVPAT